MSHPAAAMKLALARIQRLCCLGIGGEMPMPDLVQDVRGLIPCRHVAAAVAEPAPPSTRADGTPPLAAAIRHAIVIGWPLRSLPSTPPTTPRPQS